MGIIAGIFVGKESAAKASPRARTLVLALIALVWVPYLSRWTLGLNSDSAVPYLMARHVLQGARPVYFWGQRYFGAFEAWFGAALLAVGGRDRPWLVDLVPLAGYIGAAALILRQAPPAERRARAFLLVAAPPGLFIAIVRPGLSQGTLLWLTWAALGALAPGHDADPLRPRAFARAGAGGLVHALGRFYIPTATLGVIALLPWLVVCLRRDGRSTPPSRRLAVTLARLAQLALVVAGAWLGDLPMRWAAPGPAATFVAESLDGAVAKLPRLGWALEQLDPLHHFGPATAGLEPYYAGTTFPRFSSPPPSATGFSALVTAGFLVLALAGAALVTGQSLRQFRSRAPEGAIEAQSGVSGIYWVTLLAGVAAAFLVNRAAIDMGSARYLTPLWLPLVCGAATAAARLPRAARRALAATWVVLVVCGHARMLENERDVDRDLTALAATLDARGVHDAIGNYWLSYLLMTRTMERIVVAPTQTSRYPPYEGRVLGARSIALLDFTGSPLGPLGFEPRADLYRRQDQQQIGIVSVTFYEREAP